MTDRRYDAVTFDVSHTLLAKAGYRRPGKRVRIAAELQARGLLVGEEQLREPFQRARQTRNAALTDGRPFRPADMVDSVFAALDMDVPADRAAFDAVFVENKRLPPAPGVHEALSRLREAGMKLGIVTNRGLRETTVMLRNLEALDLWGFFDPDAIVCSDEVGVRKPHPKIFHFALARLGVEPGRCAHVGNSKEADVQGARGVGMATIRFSGVRDATDDDSRIPDADAVIRHFDELPAALGL